MNNTTKKQLNTMSYFKKFFKKVYYTNTIKHNNYNNKKKDFKIIKL